MLHHHTTRWRQHAAGATSPAGWWRCFVRFVRTPLVVFLLLFVWLQLMMVGVRQTTGTTSTSTSSSGGGGSSSGGANSASGPYEGARNANLRDRSQQTYAEFLHRAVGRFGSSTDPNYFNRTWIGGGGGNDSLARGGGNNNNNNNGSLGVDEIRRRIALANAEQRVLNAERWGALPADAVVFVVQVHTRRGYLENLIESFRQTRGIEGALLVFSHDVYDADINAAVQSITFARVMQIFYPFSTQLHNHSFPGQDPHDCPWDIKKEEALKLKCNNAEHPDLYGHYREAKYTQIKHHWWWKINRVFNGVRVLLNHSGLVVFLEEDHYVVPDVLHVLGLLDKKRNEKCPQCNVLSLGTYLKTVNFGSDAKKVEVWPWIASKHNMGMVLKRDTWEEIRACSEKFCYFDDYNWDWSLQHISATCLKQKLSAVMIKTPRVFHIGECGVHHKEKNCDANQMLTKVQRLITLASKHLFPSKLDVTRVTRRTIKNQKGNGGWGDVRDHWLCVHLLNATLTA